MISSLEKEQLREKTYNANIIYKKLVHDNLAIFHIKVNDELNSFTPGQYLSIGHFDFDIPQLPNDQVKGKLVRRAYSVSSPLIDDKSNLLDNVWDNTVELYIAKVDGGTLSPNIFELETGDSLFVSPKFIGHYTLAENLEAETVIFISTGTGLAPHIAMLNFLLHQNYQGKIFLLECSRYKKDLAYFDKLTKISQNFHNVLYKPLTTRDSDKKIYLQDYIKYSHYFEEFNLEIKKNSTHIYLCGNPDMIGIPKKNRDTGDYEFPVKNGMCEILMESFDLDIYRPKSGGQIHFEKYW